jgi:hypothetical protein
MRRAILALSLALMAAPAAAQPSSAPAVSPELIRLHDDLKLSPAQEASWGAYTRAIAPSAAVDGRRRETDRMLPGLTTPRRIALIAANMAADEADFRKLGAAVTAFYGQLTPAQQKTFDDETLPGRGTPR